MDHELLASRTPLRQRSDMNAAARPAPALRRAYFDCRFGQLHVYQAIPAGGGIHALVAAPTTDVVSLPAVNEIEIDGDASGPPCLIEFMSSPGVILRAETVSGTGRFRRGWSAAGTIIIRLTGLELILYGLRGT